MSNLLLSLALSLQRPFFRNQKSKVWFPLMRDADGYPPYDSESLWAVRRGWELFEVTNIPFFVRNLAMGDLVSATSRNGILMFSRMERKSGMGTLRVIFEPHALSTKPQFENLLTSLSCDWEWKDEHMIAVAVGSLGAQQRIADEIGPREKAGELSYEISAAPNTS